MTPSETIVAPCICGDLRCTVPYGECHCYCGEKTKLARRNGPRGSLVKGQPKQFIIHHQRKLSLIEYLDPFDLDGVPCRLIPLTQGYYSVVDEVDYYHLARWSWYVSVMGAGDHIYAGRFIYKGGKDGKDAAISMHRYLMGFPEGMEVDHKNGNGLDNRRSKNLRTATIAQNRQNSIRRKPSITGLRGVFPDGCNGFKASISVNGEQMYLGRRKTPQEAFVLYCEAAAKYHGEFARFD